MLAKLIRLWKYHMDPWAGNSCRPAVCPSRVLVLKLVGPLPHVSY